jgi:hypothetical protein
MSGPSHFLVSRWRREVTQGVLFWRDLVLVGTLINVMFTMVALIIAATSKNMALAAAVHFTPLPYNLFLVAALWRLPAAGVFRWASLAWLALVTLV